MVEKKVKKKILIVEDEPDIAETLKFRLWNAGFEVINAFNGAEALELAHSELPDIILLDLVLPKMDGFQVCKALKLSDYEKYNRIPIIVMTARGQLMDEEQRTTMGADDYLTKPFDFMDLLERIKEVLRKRGETGEGKEAEEKRVMSNERTKEEDK